jgi:hypothetical protein
LSQEQVPSLHIQHLPNRLRFTLQQKIARAAQLEIKSSYKNFTLVSVFSVASTLNCKKML